MSSLPYTDDDPMLLDDEGDADGEDQLIDEDPAVQSGPLTSDNLPPSPLSAPALSTIMSTDERQSPRKRRTQDSVSHGPVDKSARKREQREREKEQQKQLIAKLIEIFEAGGGTCAVQQGQKKFPWVDLPAALIRIGCYFAGWPEKCLPKMSDKHPDRIDASTGPSQWSLKQKRSMEAQIAKGAVKVLPRPEDRAVIFEIVDDFGNVKDSTVEFSENWVRNKLLGLGVVATPPTPHPPSHNVYAAEHRRVMPSISSDIEYSPPSHSLDLPPIRDRSDYKERLDLPSLSQMTSRSGLHTPEDGSRSPSPLSNFSESRYYPSNLHHPGIRQQHCPPFTSSTRSTYPTTSNQDDYLSSRGRMLTLEHGLPRTATSLRSTSRPRTNHPLHHHPYSQIMASSSASSLRSRPPSPLSVNTRTHSHSRSHSGITVSISSSLLPDNTSINNVTRGIVAPYSTGPSPSGANSGQHRFPSHVPNVPLSVVAWDSLTRGWVLKVQDEVGFRALPCYGGGIVCWHRELDEWECRSAQPEIGKALWNRQAGRWELQLPPEEDIDAFLASGPHVRRAVFPTHFPAADGICAYDSGRLQAWVFHPTPAYEAQLPISPCIIVWSTERKHWSLLSESPQGADVAWSHQDKTWHFNMQSGQSQSTHSAAVRSTGQLQPSTSSSPRPSSAPHPNTLPPMVVRASSPIQSPTRSNPNRPMSTASSSF